MVIRTDFSNTADWRDLCQRIEAISDERFGAHVAYFDDPRLAGLALQDLLLSSGAGRFAPSFSSSTARPSNTPSTLSQSSTCTHAEPGRTFRVAAAEMWGMENNLSLSNMDFSEFANNVDPDGVFRGFR